MNKNAPIGFSQIIKHAWLDFTAQKKLEGNSSVEVRAALEHFLSNQLSVGNNSRRNSRQKAISILSKIWLRVPKEIEPFRDEGLALFKSAPKNTRIALHFGMAIAIYPFFATSAENMGRLLKLQSEVSTAQLQKRMREKLGERDTVVRATRQLIRCWDEWGILTASEKKGVYKAVKPQTITDSRLTTWLLESALIASQGQSAILHNLTNYTPALFPFRLSSDYFIPNDRLETFKEGVREVGVTFSDYRTNDK
jgi:hypothetical protein